MMTYVVATDQSCSVKDFVEEVYSALGFHELSGEGTGVESKLLGKAPRQASPQLLLEIDPALFRPGEVPYLHGDTSKVRRELGWRA